METCALWFCLDSYILYIFVAQRGPPCNNGKSQLERSNTKETLPCCQEKFKYSLMNFSVDKSTVFTVVQSSLVQSSLLVVLFVTLQYIWRPFIGPGITWSVSNLLISQSPPLHFCVCLFVFLDPLTLFFSRTMQKKSTSAQFLWDQPNFFGHSGQTKKEIGNIQLWYHCQR